MMASSTGTVHKSLHVPDWEKVSSSLKMMLECGTPSAEIGFHLVQQQQSSSKTSFIQLFKTQYQKLLFLDVLHDAEQNETLQINLVKKPK
jgi:hypothetical protein